MSDCQPKRRARRNCAEQDEEEDASRPPSLWRHAVHRTPASVCGRRLKVRQLFEAFADVSSVIEAIKPIMNSNPIGARASISPFVKRRGNCASLTLNRLWLTMMRLSTAVQTKSEGLGVAGAAFSAFSWVWSLTTNTHEWGLEKCFNLPKLLRWSAQVLVKISEIYTLKNVQLVCWEKYERDRCNFQISCAVHVYGVIYRQLFDEHLIAIKACFFSYFKRTT